MYDAANNANHNIIHALPIRCSTTLSYASLYTLPSLLLSSHSRIAHRHNELDRNAAQARAESIRAAAAPLHVKIDTLLSLMRSPSPPRSTSHIRRRRCAATERSSPIDSPLTVVDALPRPPTVTPHRLICAQRYTHYSHHCSDRTMRPLLDSIAVRRSSSAAAIRREEL